MVRRLALTITLVLLSLSIYSFAGLTRPGSEGRRRSFCRHLGGKVGGRRQQREH